MSLVLQKEMTARGAEVAMTREDHASGTDRLAEVVAQLGLADDQIVVNLQGDETIDAGNEQLNGLQPY